MCEWLSREEWCDVSLLCGGQVFGAHRAVLASVSSFLRRILLSCPTEDTPTLIVLPEFDLEALSAVLYYIYNGEVTMPRQKVEQFLDIVKAMQIFIDQQYLAQLSINIDVDYKVNNRIENNFSVFILRSENDDTKSSLVTFRKLFLHIKDHTDYNDSKAAPRHWNEQFKPILGNLQSAHKDRQRDYFLRDSFMETYPRNRNANGRAAGVLAIPNRCYRSPTTLFLTNAKVNGHLSPDTANLLSDNDAASKMAYNLRLTSKPHQDNMISTEICSKRTNLSGVWTEQPVSSVSAVETFRYNVKHRSYLDLSTLQKSHTVMPTSAANNKIPWFSKSENCMETKAERSISYNSQHKATILNKALDSPWCPRLPNCFRPFRRKGPNLNCHLLNDNNNNVQLKSTLMEDERLETATNLCNSDHYIPTTCSSLEENKCTDNSQQSPSRGRYTCSECNKSFSQLRNFKYHMSVHRGTREFAASCSVCGKSFNDRGYLSSHMKIHRNRKEYKCSQCPKSFNQRVAYNMHVRIHTGLKPHVCPTCGKAFSRKMLLKQHQRTHSGERPYACPHCEKRFADRSNMTLHLRLHTGVKPFKCPMCPKSFTKKHHLKSHVNFHTGAKPYSCPRCNLAFTQSSNMRTHLKRCTAPEPTTGTSGNSA